MIFRWKFNKTDILIGLLHQIINRTEQHVPELLFVIIDSGNRKIKKPKKLLAPDFYFVYVIISNHYDYE